MDPAAANRVHPIRLLGLATWQALLSRHVRGHQPACAFTSSAPAGAAASNAHYSASLLRTRPGGKPKLGTTSSQREGGGGNWDGRTRRAAAAPQTAVRYGQLPRHGAGVEGRTDVHEPPVVLDALRRPALRVLLLVRLRDLGRLPSHLAGTSQGPVHLACGGEHHKGSDIRCQR